MTNPYASRLITQFFKACVHMVHMSDRAPREINNASGAEGVFMACTGPFSPSRLAEQFIERAQSILSIPRSDVDGEARELLGLIQLTHDEDIIPALSVAQTDWDTAAGELRKAVLNTTIDQADFEELATSMDSAMNGLNTARDALLMDIVPNTHLLLSDLKVKLG